MKLFFTTALALVAANAAAAANDDPQHTIGLGLAADLVYVAADDVDADASSHQIDVNANQAHVTDEIEKKNNAPKYLRGVWLEEVCDNKGQPFSYCSFTKVWATGICKVVYASSSGSSIYSSGYCKDGDLYCCK